MAGNEACIVADGKRAVGPEVAAGADRHRTSIDRDRPAEQHVLAGVEADIAAAEGRGAAVVRLALDVAVRGFEGNRRGSGVDPGATFEHDAAGLHADRYILADELSGGAQCQRAQYINGRGCGNVDAPAEFGPAAAGNEVEATIARLDPAAGFCDDAIAGQGDRPGARCQRSAAAQRKRAAGGNVDAGGAGDCAIDCDARAALQACFGAGVDRPGDQRLAGAADEGTGTGTQEQPAVRLVVRRVFEAGVEADVEIVRGFADRRQRSQHQRAGADVGVVAVEGVEDRTGRLKADAAARVERIDVEVTAVFDDVNVARRACGERRAAGEADVHR